jgi:hypothetical protein
VIASRQSALRRTSADRREAYRGFVLLIAR